MSVFDTTDPETIREALAGIVQTVIPRLARYQDSRWTRMRDGEIAGTLRNFDIKFAPEVEVGTPGAYGAYGGGITFRTMGTLTASYPVGQEDIERLVGADLQDLTAILERLHESVAGMFAMANSVDRRVVSAFTGSDGAYTGTFVFEIHFFASDQVAVAS